jgi:hypothetical protein
MSKVSIYLNFQGTTALTDLESGGCLMYLNKCNLI